MLDQIKKIFSEANAKDMLYSEVSKKLQQLDDKEFQTYAENSIERMIELQDGGDCLRDYYWTIECALAVFLRGCDETWWNDEILKDETWNNDCGVFGIAAYDESGRLWYHVGMEFQKEDYAQWETGEQLMRMAAGGTNGFECEWADNYVSPEQEEEMEAAE